MSLCSDGLRLPSGRPVGKLGDKAGINGAFTSVKEVALSPDGRYVAVAGHDTVHLFDGNTSSEIWRFKRGRPGETSFADGVSFSAGGDRLGAVFRVSRSAEGRSTYAYSVLLFERGSNAPLWEYVSPPSERVASASLRLSADGSHLAVYREELVLFSSSSGAPLWSKSDFTGWVQSVAVSAGGDLVAASLYDSTVRLLDRSGTTLWSQREMGQSVAISDDGRTMAVSSNASAQLLNVPEMTVIWEYRFP